MEGGEGGRRGVKERGCVNSGRRIKGGKVFTEFALAVLVYFFLFSFSCTRYRDRYGMGPQVCQTRNR